MSHPEPHPEPHPELETLAAYHAGALTEPEERRLQDHLVGCPECAALLLDLDGLGRPGFGAGSLSPADQEALWKSLQEEIREEERPPAPVVPLRRPSPVTPRWLPVLAAALLAVAIGLSVWVASLRRTVGELSRPQLATPIVDLYSSGSRSEGSPRSAETVPAGAPLLTVILHPENPRGTGRYRVEIARGGETVWRSEWRSGTAARPAPTTPSPWRCRGAPSAPASTGSTSARRTARRSGTMSCASRALSAAGTLLALLPAACGRPSPVRTPAARPLPAVAGRALEASLPEGATQVYEIDLAAGTFAGLAVDQRGVDVAVSVEGPDGRRLAASDSHFGAWGVEPVPVIAERPGRYRLVVRPSGATERTGRYEVRLEALRPATPRDRARVAAEALLTRGEELRRNGDRASLTAAVAAGLQALAGFRALDERGRVADTLYTLAYAAIDLDRLDDALAYDREALELFRSLRREREVGRTLDVLGQIHRAQGDTRQALALYGEALALDRRLGERTAEATTLMNLGRAYRAQGETDQAVACYRQALDLWRALGNRGREAATLASLGDLYQFLGDSRAALVHLEPALAIFTAQGNEREQARTLNSMGGAYSRQGDGRKGIEALRRALALERRLGDRRGEAVTLNDLGCAAILLGDWRGAGAYFARGRARFQEIGDRPAEAVALANAAGAAVRLDPRRAIAGYEAALPRLAAFGDRDTEASALLGLAQGRRGAGDLAGALAAVEEGIARVESLRGASASREIRTAFLASKQDFYSFEVDLLMERHRRAPGEGWEARALAANERARARGLLDLLAESHAGLTERRRAPLPLPASVAEIRREALDGDTLLLEYALGGSRSFLWAVTRDGLAVFELPPRREIEEVARRAYRALSSRQTTLEEGPVREALGRLSRMLLQPAAGLLGGSRRLLVVPDGALHYIPFAALPAPGSGEPLAATHEVVSSPSASALVVERRGLAGRRPAPGTLAVVADPVFDAGDPRIAGRSSADPAPQRGADRFRRLPYSRREAEALLALVPPERRLSALGFAASRETVLSGRLAGYRIVHFASHGVLDPANPDLSRLVLSQVDERGRPRDGSVRARELYALSLPADLVVLSACRTALGQEVRGEGLIGLTRGFQHAGARAVLVSLWEVDDQATAELMRLFYREMLHQGRPPAAALRTAQEALRRQERWRPPYFWAGFTLQGDWRAVPTPPSMPPGPLPGGLSRRTR